MWLRNKKQVNMKRIILTLAAIKFDEDVKI